MGIASLLNPRSVAIVGASEKVGPGYNAFKAMDHVGFTGRIDLVNPRSPELFGRPTFASLDDIPGTVDAVFIAVQADAVLDVARAAARKGAGALAILSSGFGETEAGIAAQRELATICAANDIAVCGPNCLGLINFKDNCALFGTSLPDKVKRGGIAAIVQSGSIGIALLNSARGLGLGYLITTGNEAVTTAADYIEAVVDDPAIDTIIVFAEQIKKPAAFVQALRRARADGKPVIVLKSGRSPSGKAAVMAHTGAIAGSDEACDAALSAAGAIQVHSLDELIETALLASTVKLAPGSDQLGALSLSGGEIALVLDAADDLGVTFAPLGAAEDTVKQLLPPFSHLSNPLDLTWAGLYDPSVAQRCAEAIASQDGVGALVLLQDAPSGLGAQQAGRYARLLEAVATGAAAAGTPLIALSNLSDQPPALLQQPADRLAVPYLRGTRVGLGAIASYIRWSNTPLPSSAPARPVTARLELPQGRLAAEHEARAALRDYGINGPPERFVSSAEDVSAAADAVGFPVVLKGVVENIVHKSDAGLVKVGLNDAGAVQRAVTEIRRAAEQLDGRFLGFLVQRKVSSICEIFVGARVDPDFGPLIAVGAGGIQVELYKDVAVRVAPLGVEGALQAIGRTRVAKLLAGFRGAAPADIHAVARTVSALSHFIADHADRVSEVEINPLAVMQDGCIALDCVILARD
ncbi:MAG: acetate--CoA ligase family protein [Tardiphaga sp.]